MSRVVNPELVFAKRAYEELFGVGSYGQKWLSLPWYTRLFMTIRGFNPGGRKGAPAL